jgi:hypothetical protein
MDLNVQAFRLVEQATSEATPNQAKKASSRKGGLKGGAARAKSITSERRAEIARKANAARWQKRKHVSTS